MRRDRAGAAGQSPGADVDAEPTSAGAPALGTGPEAGLAPTVGTPPATGGGPSAPTLAAPALTAFALLGLALLLPDAGWRSGAQLHTLVELASTLLAGVAGVTALARYNARPDGTILLFGAGFLGTALFDGYHTLVTSPFFSIVFPSAPESLIPWSWNASRTFLGLMMLGSALVWGLERRLGRPVQLRPRSVYATTALLTLSSFAFFALVPLGRAHFPELVVARPGELLPGLLFLGAAAAILARRDWRQDPLEFWVLHSLIVGAFCQLAFMSRSLSLFDGAFDAAHVLKLLSYALVLVGLLSEIQASWRRTERLALALGEANRTLEDRVARRTAELAEANAALARSNVELGQFAYVASHDLQSPLRAVSQLVDLFEDEFSDSLDREGRAYLDRIGEACRRMQRMITDLLSYSRLDSRDAEREATDLNDVLADVLELLAADVERAGAIVTSDPLPTIDAVAHQMTQLLQNLVGNALKYRSHRTPRIHVSAETRDGRCILGVRDNGVGIAEPDRERVFELFRRLHAHADAPGTGIGLATCRRIVEGHGGRIAIESVLGEGSTFRCDLPMRTAPGTPKPTIPTTEPTRPS